MTAEATLAPSHHSLPVDAVKTLRQFLAALGALLSIGAAQAAQPLLSPAELKALLPQASVRVIDIRDAESYGQGHVPGAVLAPYGSWRGPASNPGELPDVAKLTELVRRLGLTPETHAVVVSSGANVTDFGAAARVYWTLKVLGLKQLSVLNGGMEAWGRAELPLETSVAKVTPSSFAPTLDASLIASREEVRAQIESGKGRLIDARPAEFFRGDTRHQAALVPGTLKGAVNVEHSRWFVPGSTTFVDAEEARKIAATIPAGADTDTVSFCNTGHWAATNWFALSEVAGQKNVKLYAGSMVDWTQNFSTALMDQVPGRLKQLGQDVRGWFARTFN